MQAAPKPTPVVPEVYRNLIDAFIECPPDDKIRRLNILSMIASHFKEDEALELLPGLKKHRLQLRKLHCGDFYFPHFA